MKKKRDEQQEPVAEATEEKSDPAAVASRARNRTVVLTPDMAGQVRAMLHNEEGGQRKRDPLSEILPPMNWDNGQRRAPEPRAENTSAPVSSGLRGSPDSQGYARPTRKSGTAKFLSQSHQQETGSPSFVVNPHMPMPTSATPAPRVSERKNKIIGFLVSYDNSEIGEVFEVCQGRWLLTSRASDQGDHIVVNDSTISPLHAILRVTADGKVQALDQLSEHGTGVTRAGSETEEEVSGSMTSLNHGDTVRFGKRKFVVCLIPLPKVETKA